MKFGLEKFLIIIVLHQIQSKFKLQQIQISGLYFFNLIYYFFGNFSNFKLFRPIIPSEEEIGKLDLPEKILECGDELVLLMKSCW